MRGTGRRLAFHQAPGRTHRLNARAYTRTRRSNDAANRQLPGRRKNIPSVGEDESYRIDITRRQAILSAPTVVGALRGLETLLQLLDADRTDIFFPAFRSTIARAFHGAV